MNDDNLEIQSQEAQPSVLSVEDFRKAQQARRQSEVRPPTETDILERPQISKSMLETAKTISPDVPIRFHGCHSYDFETIIKSGKLQSGADLAEKSTSFDKKGEISVSSSTTLRETIGDLEEVDRLRASGQVVDRAGYIDILDNEVPLGCTFVLFPETEEEANKGQSDAIGMNQMDNVDLKGNKFSRVLVSDEFYNRAQGILMMNGLDENKVMRYSEFPGNLSKIVDEARANNPYLAEYKAPAKSSGFSVSL